MKKSGLMLLSLLGGLMASNMFGMAGQPVDAVTGTFTNEPVSALLPASEPITPEKIDANDDQEKHSEEAADESTTNETSEIGTQPTMDEEQTTEDEPSDLEEEVVNEASDDEAEVSSDMARADEEQITEEVGTEQGLIDAFKKGNNIHLTQDVTLKKTNADLTKLNHEGIVISGEREDGGVHTLNITTGDSSLGALAYSSLLKDKYITFRQLNIVNDNFWGIFPSTSASTIRFDTVTYSGPQPIRMTNGWAEFTGVNHFTVNRNQEFAEIGSLHFKSGKTTIVNTSTANSFLWTYSTTKSAGLFVSGGAEVDITSSRYINYSTVSGTKINVDGLGSTLKINTPSHIFGTTSGGGVTATNGGRIDIKASNLYHVKSSSANLIASDQSNITLNLSGKLAAGAGGAVPITATNNSRIDVKTKDDTYYGSNDSSPITASNQSEITIDSDKSINTSTVSKSNIVATDNSNIKLKSTAQMFGTFSTSEIRSGLQPDSDADQSEGSQDNSTITLSSQQDIFGTLTAVPLKVEQGATMEILGQNFAETVSNSGTDNLFKVAKGGTLNLKMSDTMLTTIATGKKIGYDISGVLYQSVGTMSKATNAITYDYKFNDESNVTMHFTSASASKNLPFTGNSTMTIGEGASVSMTNSGNKLPIISGNNNTITVGRAYVEMIRSMADTSDSPLFENVKISLPQTTFRQIQTTDLLGNQQKYPYINFQANHSGTKLDTISNNTEFNLNFTNQLKKLIIGDVARPVVTPNPLEVQPGQKIFKVEGTATPGTNLRLKFIGTDGKELVTQGEGRELTVTTAADGKFLFDITLDEALSTNEKEVNFAIIVEANYPAPDQLAWPVTAYVKQYDPAIVEFVSVPDMLDFGTQNLTDINKDIQPAVTGDFIVKDNRTGDDRIGFSIMVRQNKTFTSETTGHQLKNSLWKQPLTLSDDSVYPGTDGKYLITDSDEVFMTVDKDFDFGNDSKIDLKAYLTGQLPDGENVPGMIQANFSGEPKVTSEKYTAELEWTLLNAPPNE